MDKKIDKYKLKHGPGSDLCIRTINKTTKSPVLMVLEDMYRNHQSDLYIGDYMAWDSWVVDAKFKYMDMMGVIEDLNNKEDQWGWGWN